MLEIAKYFLYILSFNPHSNSRMWVLLLVYFTDEKALGSGRVRFARVHEAGKCQRWVANPRTAIHTTEERVSLLNLDLLFVSYCP